MEDENPNRPPFVTIVEVNGQTFAPGVARILNINSQPSGSNPASMSYLRTYVLHVIEINILFIFFLAGVVPGSTGGDYVNVINQAVTIGNTTFSFVYQLLDDDVVEPSMMETFQLVLSPGASGPVNIPTTGRTATITITDDDG